MEEMSVLKYLLQQAPIVVFMGVVIWWLAKRYEKKDQQCEKLSIDIISLASHWEEWLRNNDIPGAHKDILEKLEEIKDILKDR